MTTEAVPPTPRGVRPDGAERREGATGFSTSASPDPASPAPTGSPDGAVPGFAPDGSVVVGFGIVSPGWVVVVVDGSVVVDTGAVVGAVVGGAVVEVVDDGVVGGG